MSTLPILFGMFGAIGFPCDPDIPLRPEEQPTEAEILFAAQEAGVNHIPTVIKSIPAECIDEDEGIAGLYIGHLDLIFLYYGWREDGGLTILVHELRHAKQWEVDEMVMSECDAGDTGARFAVAYHEWDRWSTEAGYSLRHCIGGQHYHAPYGADDEFYKLVWNVRRVFPELTEDYRLAHDPEMMLWGFLNEAAERASQEDGKDVDSD